MMLRKVCLTSTQVDALIRHLEWQTKGHLDSACTCVGDGLDALPKRTNDETGHERGCMGVAYTKEARAFLARLRRRGIGGGR